MPVSLRCQRFLNSQEKKCCWPPPQMKRPLSWPHQLSSASSSRARLVWQGWALHQSTGFWRRLFEPNYFSEENHQKDGSERFHIWAVPARDEAGSTKESQDGKMSYWVELVKGPEPVKWLLQLLRCWLRPLRLRGLLMIRFEEDLTIWFWTSKRDANREVYQKVSDFKGRLCFGITLKTETQNCPVSSSSCSFVIHERDQSTGFSWHQCVYGLKQ